MSSQFWLSRENLKSDWWLEEEEEEEAITAHELTQRRFVQEVQLCVEGADLGIFLLDDADDEVQQRLLPVRRFGVQQLRRANRKQSETNGTMTSEALQRKH